MEIEEILHEFILDSFGVQLTDLMWTGAAFALFDPSYRSFAGHPQ